METKCLKKADSLKCILAIVGIALSVAAMILVAIVTKNDGKVEVSVIVVTIVAMCLSGVTLFFDYADFGKMLAAGAYLCSCVLFISTQLGNLGYALAGIHDIGNGIQPGFIVGTIFYIASTVLQSIIVFKKIKNQENK